MSVLSHQTIERLCRGPNPLVDPYDPAQVRTASYDLRVGNEYYVSSSAIHMGCIKINTLGNPHRKVIQIPPNQLVIIRTMENVKLSNKLVGHLTLKLEVLLHGIIMASQSQVDAGYEGPLFALLYNLSSEPVNLCFGESVLRLEFAELDHATVQTYHGSFLPNLGLADVVHRSLTSSLSSMAATVANLRRASYAAIAGLVVALVAIVFALVGPLQQESSNANANSNSTDAEVTRLHSQVDTLSSEVATLQGQLNLANQRLSELLPQSSSSTSKSR